MPPFAAVAHSWERAVEDELNRDAPTLASASTFGGEPIELREQSYIIVKPGYTDSALLSGANVPPPDKSHL